MRFYEDIQIGDRSEYGSHTFEAEEIKAFSRRFDPLPFHVDEEAARHSLYGALCASGWHTGAVCMRLSVDYKTRERAAMEAAGEPTAESGPSPGLRDIRWIKPVYPGDTVTFASEVTGKRETSRPKFGLITHSTRGTNQNGELVYSVQGAVFVERRTK